MTTIKHTPHYAAQLQQREQALRDEETNYITQRRFDDLKTLIFALVVAAPIATVVGMVIGDWIMIGLALFISSSCGITSLYLLRRLETHILRR